MVTQGTVFQCMACQTEVEVVNAQSFGGPLVCCEVEMKQVEMDEFEKRWEAEAYDAMDYQWD
jgi:hypothetical protein